MFKSNVNKTNTCSQNQALEYLSIPPPIEIKLSHTSKSILKFGRPFLLLLSIKGILSCITKWGYVITEGEATNKV